MTRLPSSPARVPVSRGHSPEARPSASGALYHTPGWWHAKARVLARTHTRRQVAEALGIPYSSVKDFGRRHSVDFASASQPVVEPLEADEPEPAEMDDDDRCRLLAVLLAAERQATAQRARDRLLWTLTSRPEPPRDVAAALAKLGAC